MLFFPQDHRYNEYRIGDLDILSFDHSSDSSNNPERRTDESHGQSSIPEYFDLERGTGFIAPSFFKRSNNKWP